MNESLNEKLDKHLSSIKEANEQQIIMKAINQAYDKSEKEMYKACLDCCRSGKFVKSQRFFNSLVEFAISQSEDAESDDDIETVEDFKKYLDDMLQNNCLTDEWEEALIADYLGDVCRDLHKANSPLYQPWLQAVQWAQDQGRAVYQAAKAKIPAEAKNFEKNILGD